jgi:hypothetical protein
VTQAVLFEFAMAARDAAEAEGRATAHHAHHEGAGDSQGAPTHEHGKDCPFCVARAAHQAPSLPAGVSLPLPSSVVAVARPAPRRRVRARRRPARFSSRSPPPRSPLLPVA